MVHASTKGHASLLWLVMLAVNAIDCKARTTHSPPPSPLLASARNPVRDAGNPVPSAAPAASAGASVLRETQVDGVQFEGRQGPRLEAICAVWRAELLAAVKSEHEAGFGFDNYDPKWIKCAPSRSKAPRLEGALPHDWSIRSSVALEYFDGAVMLDDRYLLLRRADGTTVIGPLYSTMNDTGDVTPPAATRLAMLPYRDTEVLVIASLEVGDRPDPMLDNGKPGPNARYTIRHSGRVCRFEPAQFACDPRPLVVYQERVVSGAERAALLRAPKVELPVLDPASGAIVVPPELAH